MGLLEDAQNPYMTFAEGAAPATPAAGLGVFYFKTDSKPYAKNDAGTEYDLTAPGGGGAAAGASLYRNAGTQSLSAGATTAITFDTSERADTGFTNNTAAGTITVANAGFYLVLGRARLNSPTSATEFSLSIPVFNVGSDVVKTTTFAVQIFGIAYLAAGTVIQMNAYSEAAGTVIAGQAQTYLRVVKLA